MPHTDKRCSAVFKRSMHANFEWDDVIMTEILLSEDEKLLTGPSWRRESQSEWMRFENILRLCNTPCLCTYIIEKPLSHCFVYHVSYLPSVHFQRLHRRRRRRRNMKAIDRVILESCTPSATTETLRVRQKRSSLLMACQASIRKESRRKDRRRRKR